MEWTAGVVMLVENRFLHHQFNQMHNQE